MSAVESFPSPPSTFQPQHRTPPFASAQPCSAPAAMAWTPLSPWTRTGTWLSAVEPFPSWPWAPFPQHSTPPFTTAQPWYWPAATLDAAVDVTVEEDELPPHA